MEKNMGTTDKGIRIVLAIALLLLNAFGIIEGILAYILIAFAVIFLLTSFISFCPLYKPFGISTCKTKK